MMRILDTTVLNEHYEIDTHRDIEIRDGKICAVREHGSQNDAAAENIVRTCGASRDDNEEQIDGRNLLFMPGLIDSHMHTGQQLLRGRVLDELPMIWTRIMLPFESTLTPEKMRFSAEIAALEMIHAGTAGFVEAGSYFMEEAAAVYERSGLRGALSSSTMDQKGLPASISDTVQSALQRTDDLYESFHGKGLLKVYYSLRSLISCSEELMHGAAERAKEKQTMLQAHMNEYAGEINFFLEKYQMRPYEFLEREGILHENFLGAHSLMLSEGEKEILKSRRVKVCHCPFSNCAKGAPDTPSLLERRISVGLGTDGTAHGGMSLWNEMKIFRSVMNCVKGVPQANPKVMPAEKILRMVLEGGAAALGEEGHLGVIREGCYADLIGIDLNQPHLLPTGNLVHTLVESVNAGDVSCMIAGGKLLMKDREIRTLDEEKILYEARRLSE